MDEAFVQLFGPRNPKIRYFIHPVVDENVGGLHVPVDDIKPMQVVEPLANLEKHLDDGFQSFVELLLIAIAIIIVMVGALLLVAILRFALF